MLSAWPVHGLEATGTFGQQGAYTIYMEQCWIFNKFSTFHIRIYPSMFVSVVIIACIVRPSQKTLLQKLLKNWRLTCSCM